MAGGIASVCVFYLVKSTFEGSGPTPRERNLTQKEAFFMWRRSYFHVCVSLLPANLGIYFMMAGGALLVAFVKRELSIYNPVLKCAFSL